MTTYLQPLNLGNKVFNVSDYDQYDTTNGLTLAFADSRYSRLAGYNSYFGTNSFFNLLGLYNSTFSIYNNSVLTASINQFGIGNFTALQLNGSDISLIFAPINSPNFIGIPTVPTAPDITNTNQIASCSYVRNNINDLIGGAPYFLDTLNEISVAIGNDPNFAGTVFALINLKQNIISATAPLNASFIGNCDVTNTVLSYLKNVTSDVNTSIVNLNSATTGISYASGTTTISNNIYLNKKSLFFTDVSTANTNFYTSQYFSGSNFYITNSSGYNNTSANIIFHFFTVNPSQYVEPVSIGINGITTNGLTASNAIVANGGINLPLNSSLIMNGNISANSTIITPSQISCLLNCSVRVRYYNYDNLFTTT